MSTTKSVCLLAHEIDQDLVRMLADGFWRAEIVDPAGHERQRIRASSKIGLISLQQAEAPRLERMRRIVEQSSHIDWIAIVSPASAAEDSVREFIGRYCVNYQTAPLDRERLLHALGHAAGMRELLGSTRPETKAAESSSLILGRSPAMRQLRRTLAKIASVDAPVLITGESGTGKELAAKTIHEQSNRSERAFVAVNCAALSPSLIHAELFGAEKGAFTGAHTRRVGQLEAANGGTIFLDEIGDLHPDLQALLLRFLEENAIRRLGGRDHIAVDARIIAATHVDLENAVREKKFREDLYYRLNVLRVRMPALREHKEDLEELSEEFLQRFASENSQRVKGFSRSALNTIVAYDWPGNVRELLNRVRRAVILADGRLVTAADLQLEADARPNEIVKSLNDARMEAERETLVAGLRNANWNASKAAALLGVSRATLYRLLEKHNLLSEASNLDASFAADASTPALTRSNGSR